MAVNWNDRIIEEFRANAGKVGGQFDGRQRVRVAVDPVALDGIERRHLAGLQRPFEQPVQVGG